MATLLLASAGAALGSSIGGSFLGLTAATLGQAAGGIVGQLIDQKIMGGGGQAVERGKTSNLRIQSSAEGSPVPRVYGRMRVAGQIIWSTRYKETVTESGGGGKGGGSAPTVREYSYKISFAVALAEGEIDRIGRIWADGKLADFDPAQYRVYTGAPDQAPDPLIEAVEGEAPAYRGVAYVVFENIPVGPYGNRIPQLNIEVFRQPQNPAGLPTPETDLNLRDIVQGVAMSPGSGEFVYETQPVTRVIDEGVASYANAAVLSGEADALVALDQLGEDLPACDGVVLVVSWFGDDLRCGECTIRPGAEFDSMTTNPVTWSVGDVTRESAYIVSRDEYDRPAFGGTPSDGSVIRYIQAMRARDYRVVFYPFILMDVPPGNTLTNPWTGTEGQPVYPWRGRITTSLAPNVGSVDQTPAAETELNAFLGSALPSHFSISGNTVSYSGPADWGFRRFILHYAYLCKAAGGVDSFCIGSELRGLTHIRSSLTTYPMVAALRQLAAEVRAILGPETKIGYAADWSEYFGHQPGDGHVMFHLDPLWMDANIDFIGIDYYMPLTDWRDGSDHLDAQITPSIYDLDYLESRYAAGEGFDWYYASDEDRANQVRTPIFDGDPAAEHWIYRPKDMEAWWSSPHHNRPGGVRSSTPTEWVPGSKPFWLTEIGCSATDKGSNQPNIFYDPKSSESAVPNHSNGTRDDLIQRRMLQAAYRRWSKPELNPVSGVYGGPMLDLANTYVWTWDARPWPEFPARTDIWSDGGNHEFGHWLSGRVSGASLADLVAEIAGEAGYDCVDVDGLYAIVDGFVQERTQTPREALQSLMLAFGFDAYASDGKLRFVMRGTGPVATLTTPDLARPDGGGRILELSRAPEQDALRRVRLSFVHADRDYRQGAVEIVSPDNEAIGVQGTDLPVALSKSRARNIAERWAVESVAARDTADFLTPPSMLAFEPGDVVRLQEPLGGEYRIDTIDAGYPRQITATRVDTALYALGPQAEAGGQPIDAGSPPIAPAFRLMDLPLVLPGAQVHQPYAAVWSDPWPGVAAIFSSDEDDGYELLAQSNAPTVAGIILDDFAAADPARWARREDLRVRVFTGALQSRTQLNVLNGLNLAAIASPKGGWEIIQFRDAELIGERQYRLTGLLRGQAGTETLIGDPTPSGASIVFLGANVTPLPHPETVIGLERHYRIGPASQPLSDPTYSHVVFTFDGLALKPYAPAHLEAERRGSGDIDIAWIRRSRLQNDAWPTAEPPLNEAFERYQVRVLEGGVERRAFEVTSPAATYTAAQQTADGVGPAVSLRVAQISDVFGPGHESEVTISG